MTNTIQEYLAERDVKLLFHFTRETNLGPILDRGLVTRDTLVAEGNESLCNDRLRLDATGAICVSISFPNYKMFWTFRKTQPDINWVLLAIEPSVLWETRAAFCFANAASNEVTAVPLEQRMGLTALKAMFGDFAGKNRATLGLASHFPTNPQAEVLLLDGVPRKYIGAAVALNEDQKTRIEQLHGDLPVVTNAGFYRYRSDFEHWK